MRSFLLQKLERDDKSVVGATVHRSFDQIPRIWPRAKYIHLLRDPRDVSRSVIEMGWAGNFFYAADTWLAAEKTWNDLRDTLSPTDYIEVRYEELICDYENVLADICRFIGVDYSEQMLDYVANSSYELPDKNLIEQWKRKLTSRQIAYVESKCGRLLEERGYAIVATSAMKTPTIVKLFLHCQNYCFRSQRRVRRYGVSLVARSFAARKLNCKRWLKSTNEEIRAIDEQHLR
jgi:hypothetical protein